MESPSHLQFFSIHHSHSFITYNTIDQIRHDFCNLLLLQRLQLIIHLFLSRHIPQQPITNDTDETILYWTLVSNAIAITQRWDTNSLPATIRYSETTAYVSNAFTSLHDNSYTPTEHASTRNHSVSFQRKEIWSRWKAPFKWTPRHPIPYKSLYSFLFGPSCGIQCTLECFATIFKSRGVTTIEELFSLPLTWIFLFNGYHSYTIIYIRWWIEGRRKEGRRKGQVDWHRFIVSSFHCTRMINSFYSIRLDMKSMFRKCDVLSRSRYQSIISISWKEMADRWYDKK